MPTPLPTTPRKTYIKDLEHIAKISSLPMMLDVIARTTSMGFVAVARVTPDAWIACSVRDDIGFGLTPGGELEINTTICNEIRQHRQPVIIDHVAEDPQFCDHHTPAQYGFQSYISVPIIKRNGSFFGTLCAIDPQPNSLSTPAITGMFQLFADLISFHLNAVEELEAANEQIREERASNQRWREFSEELESQVEDRTRELQEKNSQLERRNGELEAFSYVASHDLQEPLRKIRFYTDKMLTSNEGVLTPRVITDLEKVHASATRMQTLVQDLISYPETSLNHRKRYSIIAAAH